MWTRAEWLPGRDRRNRAGKLRMHGNPVGFGMREALESDSRDCSQRSFIDAQLAMEHAFCDQ